MGERATELEKEVTELKEACRESDASLQQTLSELDASRQEKATLQSQGQQMLRDAERVSSLARERAHALEEKGRLIEELQKAISVCVCMCVCVCMLIYAHALEEKGRLIEELQKAISVCFFFFVCVCMLIYAHALEEKRRLIEDDMHV